jgi:hypothetical protein
VAPGAATHVDAGLDVNTGSYTNGSLDVGAVGAVVRANLGAGVSLVLAPTLVPFRDVGGVGIVINLGASSDIHH